MGRLALFSAASASLDQSPIPKRLVLTAQRNELTFGRAARRPARLCIKHQRQQTPRLRLVRKKLSEQLSRKIASPASSLRAGSVPVASAHPSAKTPRRLNPAPTPAGLAVHRGSGMRKGMPRLPNLCLGPHQPLRHGCGRNQKGRRDLCCFQSQNYLQHQRSADRRDPIAGCAHAKRSASRRSGNPSSAAAIMASANRSDSSSLDDSRLRRRWVDEFSACCGQQPRLRIIRAALLGPRCQRGREGLRQRIFRSGNIAKSSRQGTRSACRGCEEPLPRQPHRLHCRLRDSPWLIFLLSQPTVPCLRAESILSSSVTRTFFLGCFSNRPQNLSFHRQLVIAVSPTP